MGNTENQTYFIEVYYRFLSKITDDIYMELNQSPTNDIRMELNQSLATGLLEELLINAIPWFEFPRKNLNSYTITEDNPENSHLNMTLAPEEINILATYMVIGWIDQQLASIEVTRMKYSGADFKMTSQANHMAKLQALRKEYERTGFHLQRLYKRRKTLSDGSIVSNMGSLMRTSARTGRVPAPSETRPNGDPIGWEDIITNISERQAALREAYSWQDISDEWN
jgi:hypothetical protein